MNILDLVSLILWFVLWRTLSFCLKHLPLVNNAVLDRLLLICPLSVVVCGRSDRVAAGWVAAERLRFGLWYLSLHCHQHLWDNRMEGVQPNHSQHRQRFVLRTQHLCLKYILNLFDVDRMLFVYVQVLSLKEPLLLCSTCWPLVPIKSEHWERPSTDRTCPISWTSSLQSLCLQWSYTFRLVGYCIKVW